MENFNPTVKVGDQQQIIYQATEDDPFYMRENVRNSLKRGDLKSS